MNKFADLFETKKEEILNSLLSKTEKEDVDMFFESCSREFAHFVANMKAMGMSITQEHIFAFFASVVVQRLNVASGNPKSLMNVCFDLANEVSKM